MYPTILLFPYKYLEDEAPSAANQTLRFVSNLKCSTPLNQVLLHGCKTIPLIRIGLPTMEGGRAVYILCFQLQLHRFPL